MSAEGAKICGGNFISCDAVSEANPSTYKAPHQWGLPEDGLALRALGLSLQAATALVLAEKFPDVLTIGQAETLDQETKKLGEVSQPLLGSIREHIGHSSIAAA